MADSDVVKSLEVAVEITISDFNHGTLDCKEFEAHVETLDKVGPRLSFTKDSCCFDCLLPTKVCQGPFEKGSGVCHVYGLISTFLVLSFRHYDHFSDLPLFQKKIDEDGLTKEHGPAPYVQKFLAMEWADIDTEVIKAVTLFREFMEWYAQRGIGEESSAEESSVE